jgi:hypothetical protein
MELGALYKIAEKNSLAFIYWNDRGLESGTLSGHFFDLIVEKSDMNIGKHILLTVNFQLFYIDYDGRNDGLFISPKILSSIRNLPFAIFIQANQALTTNIEPYPEFEYNFGMIYYFR